MIGMTVGMTSIFTSSCADSAKPMAANTGAKSNSCPTIDSAAMAARPGVNWSGCDLKHAQINFDDGDGPDEAGVNLSGADLHGADLFSADLRYANLTNANLSGADLRYGGLMGAKLQGANLTGVKWLGTVCPDRYADYSSGGSCASHLGAPSK